MTDLRRNPSGILDDARRDHDEVYLVASITTNSLMASHADSYISAVSYMEMAQGPGTLVCCVAEAFQPPLVKLSVVF
ncbi:MAG: hypothetical protein D4R79_14700 [Comamonadaceae bacterium]|jgi:hypothetical protein|nr:MAG: hypothetical protein D4R79_14700 [Comamonadaceae bacterium]